MGFVQNSVPGYKRSIRYLMFITADGFVPAAVKRADERGFCSAAVAPTGDCGFIGVNVCWEVLGNPHGNWWVTVTASCSSVLHQSPDVNTINKRVPSLDKATLLLWIWTFKRTAARMRCVPLQLPRVNGLLMKQGNSRNQSCWHLILLQEYYTD